MQPLSAVPASKPTWRARPAGVPLQALVAVMLASFFTLLGLFGPQAMAPVLALYFGTSTTAIGVAINIALGGMIAAGLLSSLFADRISRKPAMVSAMALLTLPTALLPLVSDLMLFEMLRIAQGFLMCVGFTMAIAYVAEEWGASGTAPMLMGAYLTGNVAANVFGRMLAGAATELVGWHAAFGVFACLNLIGAALLQAVLPEPVHHRIESNHSAVPALQLHFRNVALCGAFAVGFLILFTFVGLFTYVNFRLAEPMFGLSSAAIGSVYLVFSPALFITLFVGRAVQRFGYRATFLIGAAVSLVGTGLTLASALPVLMLGLALLGSGLFFSQAVATGFTGYAAARAKGTASGLYLSAYYTGGLCGAWGMGILFASRGWSGCAVLGILAIVSMMAVVSLTWTEAANPRRLACHPPSNGALRSSGADGTK
jgi:YNFM family putative membrane transporter